MTQLNPPVTTATGTLAKVYRKESMPRKPRGIAKSFLKGSSREEDQQAGRSKVPPGNQASSSPSRPMKGTARGSTPNPNFRADRSTVTAEGFGGGPPGSPGFFRGGGGGAERGTRSVTKGSSREEDQQLAGRNVPEGNRQASSPTRSRDPGGKGNTPAPNFTGEEQERRHGLSENGPAGRPTAEAGGIGRGGGATQAGERFPRVERAKSAAGKTKTAGSAIDEAIEDGARDFNDQVKHRSKMIRDGRKRSNDRHK